MISCVSNWNYSLVITETKHVRKLEVSLYPVVKDRYHTCPYLTLLIKLLGE
jgi:hypothetical protein